MESGSDVPRPLGALVSLGGSPEPVIWVLNRLQPEIVLLFVSRDSSREVGRVMGALDYQVRAFDQIVTPSVEVLSECYRVLRQELPRKLAHWGLRAADLAVDYTGGTKPMSAALVLATADQVHQYSYVGGVERDKGGLGVVVAGKERVWFVQNPWKDLARDELMRVAVLFQNVRYLIAHDELVALAEQADAETRPLLAALAKLALGLAHWDAFGHTKAVPLLGDSFGFFKVYALSSDHARWRGFAAEIEASLSFLRRIPAKSGSTPVEVLEGGRAVILDLIANADRRARVEHKYEDAVARLYSCVERAARFRLLARTPAIDNEKVPPALVPEVLREEFTRRFGDGAKPVLKMPLDASFQLLAALEDPLGAAFAARQAEARMLLALRNRSILGHGMEPVTEEGYRRFRAFVVSLLAVGEEELPRLPEPPAVVE